MTNNTPNFKTQIKRVINHFMRGLLLILPLFGTVYAIYLVGKFLYSALDIGVPGLGIAVFVLIVTIAGYFSTSFLFRAIGDSIEYLIFKAPLLKLVYTSIKDMLKAFVGKKKMFDQPVLVKANSTDQIFRMGFITKENVEEITEGNFVAVYIPMSYSFSGNLHFVPRELITPLPNLPAADAMKFIVSGGVTTIDEKDAGEN